MAARRARASLVVLCVLLLIAAVGPALAPYDPAEQYREHASAGPTELRWRDPGGRRRWTPLACTGTVCTPVRLMQRVATNGLNDQIESHVRFVAVDPPGHLFLLGTDRLGRDRLSRLLHGAQLSLGAGLAAAALSLAIGALLGGLAGAAGRWVDATVMRLADLFLAVPWLYLLLATRASLPLETPPSQAFALMVVVIGIAGWARPARLVRGVVTSGRSRSYVEAARSCGAGPWYVLRRHLLPQALRVIIAQGAMLAPQFALAEMTLSFFGVGLGEPLASWGGLLAEASRDHLLQPTWYSMAPVAAVIVTFLAYQRAADAISQWSAQVPT